MPHYRAYLLDADDHILAGLDLDCETEAAAIGEASRLYGEHTIEIWQAARKVGLLRPAITRRLSDAIARKRFPHLPWSNRPPGPRGCLAWHRDGALGSAGDR